MYIVFNQSYDLITCFLLHKNYNRHIGVLAHFNQSIFSKFFSFPFFNVYILKLRCSIHILVHVLYLYIHIWVNKPIQTQTTKLNNSIERSTYFKQTRNFCKFLSNQQLLKTHKQFFFFNKPVMPFTSPLIFCLIKLYDLYFSSQSIISKQLKSLSINLLFDVFFFIYRMHCYLFI